MKIVKVEQDEGGVTLFLDSELKVRLTIQHESLHVHVTNKEGEDAEVSQATTILSHATE